MDNALYKLYYFIGFLIWSGYFLPAQEGWQVGLIGGPQKTYMYNYDDWHEDNGDGSSYWTVENNYGIRDICFFKGLRLSYQWEEKLGIVSGVILSKQQQNYKQVINNKVPFSSSKAYTEIIYIRTPIILKFNFIKTDAVKLYIGIGPQASFLIKLMEYYHLFDVNAHGYSLNTETKKYHEYYTNYQSYNIGVQIEDQKRYSVFTVDVIGNIGFRYSLSQRLLLELIFRADYGLTNMENAKNWSDTYKIGGLPLPDGRKRRPTHNITYGLGVGISYNFGWYK